MLQMEDENLISCRELDLAFLKGDDDDTEHMRSPSQDGSSGPGLSWEYNGIFPEKDITWYSSKEILYLRTKEMDFKEGEYFSDFKRSDGSGEWIFESTAKLVVPGKSLDFVNMSLRIVEDNSEMLIFFPRKLNGDFVLYSDSFTLVRIKFLKANKKVAFVKYFHIDPKVDPWQAADSPDEKIPCCIASPCNVQDLRNLCQYEIIETDGIRKKIEFIPVQVEVVAELDNSMDDCHFNTFDSFPQKISVSNNEISVSSSTKSSSYRNFDVIFKVGQNSTKVETHKCVLSAAHSIVFRRMFMKSVGQENPKEIELKGVSRRSMINFYFYFLFIYNSKAEFRKGQIRMLLEVLAFAYIFKVNDLVVLSVGDIVGNADEEFIVFLALEVFVAGSLRKIPDLEFRSLQWMKRNNKMKSPAAAMALKNFFQHNWDLAFNFLTAII